MLKIQIKSCYVYYEEDTYKDTKLLLKEYSTEIAGSRSFSRAPTFRIGDVCLTGRQ